MSPPHCLVQYGQFSPDSDSPRPLVPGLRPEGLGPHFPGWGRAAAALAPLTSDPLVPQPLPAALSWEGEHSDRPAAEDGCPQEGWCVFVGCGLAPLLGENLSVDVCSAHPRALHPGNVGCFAGSQPTASQPASLIFSVLSILCGPQVSRSILAGILRFLVCWLPCILRQDSSKSHGYLWTRVSCCSLVFLLVSFS